jgi:DNA-binding FadR family transcriptional regulator
MAPHRLSPWYLHKNIPYNGREDLNLLRGKLTDYLNYQSMIYDRKRAELDIDFHMQVALMGKNNFFVSMVRQFYEQMYFKINFSLLTPYIEQFEREHRLLVNAIRRRDLKEGIEIIRSHSKKAFQMAISK